METLKQTINLTEVVKNNKVNFDSYRAGFFYYTVGVGDSEYRFPIEANDIGQATLLASDKAIIYMRWIRKAIDGHQFIKTK
jgi:hypothetical protein